MLFRGIKIINKVLLIILVTTANLFGIVDVQEIKNQKYLNLGYKYIVHIPRRNHELVPTSNNQEMIEEERQIISNRLFEGASTSNLNNSTGTGGGQCVQFTKNVYYPLKIGKRPSIDQAYPTLLNSIYNNIHDSDTVPNGVRNRINDCTEGDLVVVDSGGGTGHIATYKSYDQQTNKISLIQSNDVSDDLKMYNIKEGGYKVYIDPIYKVKYHERFTVGNFNKKTNTSTYAISQNNNIFSMTKPSNGSNKFVCIDPDTYYNDTDIPNNDAKYYRTVLDSEAVSRDGLSTNNIMVNSRPWLYYLVDRNEDGFSKDGTTYSYAPDLLPVAPVKFNNENRMIGGKDSKYEIYASDNNKDIEFKLFEGDNSINNIKNTDESINFNNNILYKLKHSKSNQTQFVMIPTNGVNSLANQKKLKVSANKKVLFSPTVIDDYYIDWSHDNNSYDTSKIKIGFWNSNGYDMPFENTYVGGSNIVANRIYESSNAVNKYFMTLGKGKKAEWHFTLSGKHKLYINVPTGNENDIEDAEYSYNGIALKATESNDDLDSDFSNWYILSEENGNQVFDLQGSESIVVKAKNGIVVVDALKLVATTDSAKTENIQYPDVKNLNNEYQKAIEYLTNKLHMFNGYEDGKFYPEKPITREEVLKIIVILSEKIGITFKKASLKKVNVYPDLNDSSDWFKKNYVYKAVGSNIMSGEKNKNDDKYYLKPKREVTYWELSKMIVQAFFYGNTIKHSWQSKVKRLWHNDFYNCLSNGDDGYTYKDEKNKNNTITSIFEINGVAVADSGILKSDGDKKPTRKEVALFLYRAYMLWKNNATAKECIESKNNERIGWKR